MTRGNPYHGFDKPKCVVCTKEITRRHAWRYQHCSNACKQKSYRIRKKKRSAEPTK